MGFAMAMRDRGSWKDGPRLLRLIYATRSQPNIDPAFLQTAKIERLLEVS